MNRLATLVIVSGLLLSGCSDYGSSTSTGGAADSIAPLSAQEAKTLTFMREEEKLARDVYRALFERWNISLFSNIAGSEQRHMDILANMLSRYGLPDPVASDSTGSFTDPTLASLYNQLVDRGSRSESEAIEVGIFIEQTDITDLRNAIEESSHADLDQAYENLLNGSFNHLSAFSSYGS